VIVCGGGENGGAVKPNGRHERKRPRKGKKVWGKKGRLSSDFRFQIWKKALVHPGADEKGWIV